MQRISPPSSFPALLFLVCVWQPASSHAPAAFEVVTIQGGLTNQLYRCTLGAGRSVLVRLYGAATERVIDRERENRIMNVLSANGFGPALYGRFNNGRCEQFLSGRSLQPDDM
jgi:thiamine kinase-like enzyme